MCIVHEYDDDIILCFCAGRFGALRHFFLTPNGLQTNWRH